MNLTVRARFALGDRVKEIEWGEAVKSDVLKVNGTVTMESLRESVGWESKIGATSAASLDGSRKTVTFGDKEELAVGHGVVSDDGSIWRTKMEGGDNYLAELGAQVRWAWETSAKRYIVILDALSCPESLRRYVWMGDRKRAAKYARRELCKWWKGLEDAEAVVFLWQTSHVGEVRNSWADVVADEAAEKGDFWTCCFGELPYASIDYRAPRCGLRQWAADKFGRRVGGKLQETSTLKC